MLNMQKWNPKTHEYEPYSVPAEWHVELFNPNMDLPINCASCGREMTYGQGYTSRLIQTNTGLGWPVCEQCYERERQEEAEAHATDTSKA